MIRSADNPILTEFREDWHWRLNAPALIQEYIDNADHAAWSAEGIPATPSDVAGARAVLGHLLGVLTCESVGADGE